MQYHSPSPVTQLSSSAKFQYTKGIGNCSNYSAHQEDSNTHQLPAMPFTNISSHEHNIVQFSPLYKLKQQHNKVQYPLDNALPEPSVKSPLNHSDDNPMPRGKNCAVYDTTAPSGYRFKFYQRSHRKKKDNINDIAAKLNVSLMLFNDIQNCLFFLSILILKVDICTKNLYI